MRATVLAAIDPLAALLRPISYRRVTATGLVMWAGGALAAALLTWVLVVADVLYAAGWVRPDTRPVAAAAIAALVVSGLGATALIRPHAGIPSRQIAAAIAGVVAYVPLVWSYTQMHVVLAARPFVQAEAPWPDRNLLRLGASAALMVIVLGLRPNARLLAARSILLREGRVDRQTLLVMALVLVVGAMGDVLHLVCAGLPSRFDGAMLTAGLLMIGVSSMLFTVGLAGVLLDVWRIRLVVLQPPPSFTQLMGDPGPGAAPPRAPTAEAGDRREAHA